MELWLFLSVAGVVAVFLGAYVAVMLIWPEWVGITGKVALEAERAHLGDTPGTQNQMEDMIDKLHTRS